MDFEKHALKKEPPEYFDLREFFATMEDLDEDDEPAGEVEPQGGPKE